MEDIEITIRINNPKKDIITNRLSRLGKCGGIRKMDGSGGGVGNIKDKTEVEKNGIAVIGVEPKK